MAFEEKIKKVNQQEISSNSYIARDEPQTQEEENSDQMQQSIMPAETMNSKPMFEGMPQNPLDRENQRQSKEYNYSPEYPQAQAENQEFSQSPAQRNPGVQEYEPQAQAAGYEDYQPYQSYSSGTSPDIITEIAEQIISEKLSTIRKNIEKAIDARNSLGTKIDYIEERLKRIEKIIDTLQSSVLRRVGDYVNDVQDIKKELIETEKTLAKVMPSLRQKKHEK